MHKVKITNVKLPVRNSQTSPEMLYGATRANILAGHVNSACKLPINLASSVVQSPKKSEFVVGKAEGKVKNSIQSPSVNRHSKVTSSKKDKAEILISIPRISSSQHPFNTETEELSPRSRMYLYRQSIKPNKVIVNNVAAFTAQQSYRTANDSKSVIASIPQSIKLPSQWLRKTLDPANNRPHGDVLRFLAHEVVIKGVKDYLCVKDYLSFLLVSKRVYNQKHIKKKIEDLIVSGITSEQRLKYWIYKCDIEKAMNLSMLTYEECRRIKCEISHEMEKDLERTFGVEHNFNENIRHIIRLQNVLKAFASKNPDIGYIQGLNFVVRNLLLMFSEEEVCLYFVIYNRPRFGRWTD